MGICVSMFFTAEDIFRSRMQMDENRNVPLLLHEEFRFDDKAKHLLLDTEKNKTLDFGQFLSVKEISGLIEGDHPGSPLDVPYYFFCRNEFYIAYIHDSRSIKAQLILAKYDQCKMKFILHATREMEEFAYLRSNSEPDIANDLFHRLDVVGCTPYGNEVIVVIQKNLGVGADIGCVYQVLQFSSPDFKEMSHIAKVPSGYYIQNKRVSVTMDVCLF